MERDQVDDTFKDIGLNNAKMGRRQNDGLQSDEVDYDPMRDLHKQKGSVTVDSVRYLD